MGLDASSKRRQRQRRRSHKDDDEKEELKKELKEEKLKAKEEKEASNKAQAGPKKMSPLKGLNHLPYPGGTLSGALTSSHGNLVG